MEEIVFSGKLSNEAIKGLSEFDNKRLVVFFIVWFVSVIAVAISVSMLTVEQTAVLFVIYIIITVVAGSIVLYGLIVGLLYFLLDFYDLPFYKPCYFDNQKTTINEWGVENCIVFDPPIKSEMPFLFGDKPFSDFSADHNSIKKVIEKGNFYIIIVGNFYKKAFVCQKDLLISGSLKEFEDVFKNKIIRIN